MTDVKKDEKNKQWIFILSDSFHLNIKLFPVAQKNFSLIKSADYNYEGVNFLCRYFEKYDFPKTDSQV